MLGYVVAAVLVLSLPCFFLFSQILLDELARNEAPARNHPVDEQ